MGCLPFLPVFTATRHARPYQGFWKTSGLWTGCPHHHLHLILAGSNKTEARTGLPAQCLGASNSLSARGQGKNFSACTKSRSALGCRVYSYTKLCLPDMPERKGWGFRAWEMIKAVLSAPKGLPSQRLSKRTSEASPLSYHPPTCSKACVRMFVHLTRAPGRLLLPFQPSSPSPCQAMPWGCPVLYPLGDSGVPGGQPG